MEYQKMFDYVKNLFTPEIIFSLIQFFIVIGMVFLIYRLTIKHILRFAEKILRIKNPDIIAGFIKYVLIGLSVLYILDLFGVNITTLLGMAGIFSVAIGFAAQTSFSNIISGFFIVSDRTLKKGDFIEIDTVRGNVHSIDLLSIKVLTPDNQIVRIPNETIIKSNLTNSTFFKIRRMTIGISVAYDSDLRKVREVLLETADNCPVVLHDPKPVILFDSFGDSGINILVGVWFKKDQFWEVRNELFISIHEALNKAGIPIPFPQVDVHFDREKNEPSLKEDLSKIDKKPSRSTKKDSSA